LRGKSWSVEEERQLRELVTQGFGISQIATIMGKGRLSVKAKVYNLGLSLVVTTDTHHGVAAAVAAATTPQTLGTNVSSGSNVVFSPNAKDNEELLATQLKGDEPLPSIEAKLRVLDAALVALEKPGLSIAEISRLNKIIQGVKVYQELFAQFVNYRALETELVELDKQLASEKHQ
jgi:hypothetical protein